MLAEQFEHLPLTAERAERAPAHDLPHPGCGIAPAGSDGELGSIFAQHVLAGSHIPPVPRPHIPHRLLPTYVVLRIHPTQHRPRSPGLVGALQRPRILGPRGHGLRIGTIALLEQVHRLSHVAKTARAQQIDGDPVPDGETVQRASSTRPIESVTAHSSFQVARNASWTSGATKVESSLAAWR